MSDTPAPLLKGNFVLLRASKLQLLLPQADVGAAEYLAAPPRASGQPGLFDLDNEDPQAPPRMALALSEKMSPLAEFPAGRFLLTSFPAQDGIVLCWDEVKVLIDVELQPQTLPPALLPPDAPLREFVEFDGALAFCCNGERLLAQAFATGS
jgi:hypothetical protein